VFIELGKFNENEIKTDTDQWLHFLKCAADEEEPPKGIDNSKILSAYEDLEKYKWTKAEHDAYIRSMLAQEAEESAMDEKFAEGEAKGRTEERIEIAREMLLNNDPLDLIMRITKLSKEEIEELK
jgi:predicted transposase/invertase (TIGR01784 family)